MNNLYLKATDNICKLMELTEQPLTNDQRSTLVGALSIWMNHKPDNSEQIVILKRLQDEPDDYEDEYCRGVRKGIELCIKALGDKDE